MNALTAQGSTAAFSMRGATPTQVLAAFVAALIGVGSLPVAVFGLAQLASTALAQLHGPGEITDFVAIYSGPSLLLVDPQHLYAPGAAAAVDRALTASDRFDRPFSFLPHAALLLAPLGRLPYGLAYLVWLAVGVASLALSAWLLAPRWRLWPLLLVLFLPAQLALIMGQTSPLALLALCGSVRLVERRPALAGMLLGLSPAMWKPQLLAPALSVAFAAARCWRALLCLAAAPLVLTAAFTAIGGADWLGDYRAQASSLWSLVSERSSLESAGQTLLGLAQSVIGPGSAAVVVAIVGGLLVEGIVAGMWWRGLRPDGRRHLQFAVLPIAAVVAAPHALGYDLTLWLASAWLLLHYVKERPSARPLVVGLALSGWASANVVILTENDLGFPWAALQGLAMLAAVAWLYASHPRARLEIADQG
jgi:hypothetical protein